MKRTVTKSRTSLKRGFPCKPLQISVKTNSEEHPQSHDNLRSSIPGPHNDLQDVTCPVWGCCSLLGQILQSSRLQFFETESEQRVLLSKNNKNPFKNVLKTYDGIRHLITTFEDSFI